MRCINNLAKSYLTSSKLRKHLVTWSIVLSTILVLTIGYLYCSHCINRTMHYDQTMATYDGYYKNVTNRQINEVIKNDNITNHAINKIVKNRVSLNELQFYLQYADKEYIDKFNYRLEKGEYPKEKNEIALTSSAINGQDFDIGDIITLNNINKDKSIEYKKFKLTGIIKDRAYDKNKRVGFISDEYINNTNKDEVLDIIFVSVKKTMNKSALIRTIADTSGIDSSNIRSRSKSQKLGEYSIIIILVIILSIISISNIFSYAIIDRVNTIGLLKAVGMTNKQLRKLFIKEGLYYYIKGIIIGIILGVGFNILTIKNMYHVYNILSFSEYVKRFVSIGLGDNYFLGLLIATVIIEAIGVVLAFLIPSLKVKKMSIVDSINFVDKIKVKKTKKKKIKIKNTSFKLAYVNLNNNRFKTVLSILTISISVVLVIYFSHNMDYTSSDLMITRGMIGDIDVNFIDYESMSYINEIKGIDGKFIEVARDAKTPVDEVSINDNYVEKAKILKEYKENNEDVDIRLFSFDNNMLEKRYKYMRTPYTLEQLKDMKNWCVVFDLFNEHDTDIGDNITINNQKIKVIGEIDLYRWNNFITPSILISKDFIENNYSKEELEYHTVALNINEKNYDEVKSKIMQRFQYNDEVYTTYIDTELKKHKQRQVGIKIMMIVFLGTISLIGLFMLINIICTSIISRKREFGMLRAIGMTKQQFNKSLLLEGNILIFFVTIISLPVGYIITKLGFEYFTSLPENSEFTFNFPFWSLIVIPIYYIIIRFIIKMSMKRMDKESVVDLIRHI